MTEVLDKEGKCETEKSSSSILKAVSTSLDVVLKVATKSGNLKGTFQRALKDAVSSIKEAVETLGTWTVTEETAALQSKTTKLETENARLQGELLDLRKDLEEIRAQVSPEKVVSSAPAPLDDAIADGTVPQEELIRAIMIQVGTMISARFEGLEERLLPEKRLRPPLAADAKRAAPAVKVAPPPAVPSPAFVPAQPCAEKSGKGKGKKPKKSGNPSAVTVSSTLEPVASTSAANDSWTTVSRRKDKKASKTPKTAKAQKEFKIPKTKSGQKQLRIPSSAAVVLQLQPSAELQGVTYASVLADLRNKVDGAGLGIKFRKAATGARILQLPGAASGSRADALADQIRNAISPDILKVSRPVKSADLCISGLDDSMTSTEVAATVACLGGCPVDYVKAGNIREHGMSGGSVIVKCPVSAAKKLARAELQIGLVSVRARLLESRPTRCFRCLRNGHVAALCGDEVDRSGSCFRCGQMGHLSRDCSALPHCPICAADGKDAAHKIGAKKCKESALKNKKVVKGSQPKLLPPVSLAATAADEVSMST